MKAKDIINLAASIITILTFIFSVFVKGAIVFSFPALPINLLVIQIIFYLLLEIASAIFISGLMAKLLRIDLAVGTAVSIVLFFVSCWLTIFYFYLTNIADINHFFELKVLNDKYWILVYLILMFTPLLSYIIYSDRIKKALRDDDDQTQSSIDVGDGLRFFTFFKLVGIVAVAAILKF